ncbi:helix-turn-helix domain-containing protein [Corynebacterium sp. p3-SID1194]|uniref:helix-turn-helix domain-containing protein n=1 Tax=Corynebacterium sp. p3-SID1194 TaxID=2916105 RepID=UPI0021A7D0FB|nr:helix-turn-helix transcriptional regulator [Corynebacterium sp. p3-SID1194]MCT1449979.1 helix-turn-helix domain-containing protein [Corynebacterium sp. p3-SID1194]
MDEVLPTRNWMSFGYSLSARLRMLRDMRGISQMRLAEMAGLSRSLVSNLERNSSGATRSSDPTMSTIYRLAYALRVPPAVLLPAVGEEVGELCWEALERVMEKAKDLQDEEVEQKKRAHWRQLSTTVAWPAGPDDTKPFASLG